MSGDAVGASPHDFPDDVELGLEPEAEEAPAPPRHGARCRSTGCTHMLALLHDLMARDEEAI